MTVGFWVVSSFLILVRPVLTSRWAADYYSHWMIGGELIWAVDYSSLGRKMSLTSWRKSIQSCYYCKVA